MLVANKFTVNKNLTNIELKSNGELKAKAFIELDGLNKYSTKGNGYFYANSKSNYLEQELNLNGNKNLASVYGGNTYIYEFKAGLNCRMSFESSQIVKFVAQKESGSGKEFSEIFNIEGVSISNIYYETIIKDEITYYCVTISPTSKKWTLEFIINNMIYLHYFNVYNALDQEARELIVHAPLYPYETVIANSTTVYDYCLTDTSAERAVKLYSTNNKKDHTFKEIWAKSIETNAISIGSTELKANSIECKSLISSSIETTAKNSTIYINGIDMSNHYALCSESPLLLTTDQSTITNYNKVLLDIGTYYLEGIAMIDEKAFKTDRIKGNGTPANASEFGHLGNWLIPVDAVLECSYNYGRKWIFLKNTGIFEIAAACGWKINNCALYFDLGTYRNDQSLVLKFHTNEGDKGNFIDNDNYYIKWYITKLIKIN